MSSRRWWKDLIQQFLEGLKKVFVKVLEVSSLEPKRWMLESLLCKTFFPHWNISYWYWHELNIVYLQLNVMYCQTPVLGLGQEQQEEPRLIFHRRQGTRGLKYGTHYYYNKLWVKHSQRYMSIKHLFWGHKQTVGPKTILGHKNIFVKTKHFGSIKNLAPKIFLVQKKLLVQKKF